MARVTGATGAWKYASPLIASVSQVVEAWVLDQRGGNSLEWETDVVPGDGRPGLFVFPMAFGNGAPFPQPTGQYDLYLGNDKVLSFTNVLRSRRWSGLGVTFSFLAERVLRAPAGLSLSLDEVIRDEAHVADGWAVLEVPPTLLASDQPLVVSIRAVNANASRNWVRLGRSGKPFRTEDVVPALLHHWSSDDAPTIGGGLALLGDIHNHSGETSLKGDRACGLGSRASLFDYARDVAGLDFFTLSEHDWQMGDTEWHQLAELTESYNSDRFVTLHGFEWTSARYGHRNVYFRGRAADFFASTRPGDPVNYAGVDDPTPTDLWAWIERTGVPALTVPHHMSAAQFPLSLDNFHDPQFDRVAEIYSCWGDSLQQDPRLLLGAHHVSQLAFIRAIEHGHRVGFVASSDSHDGHPGNAQGTPVRNHLFHFLGSGLTGVIVEERTREAVFDAMHARRCFAATSAGLLVASALEGEAMGCEVPTSQLPDRPVFGIEIRSEQPLERVEIYKNAMLVDSASTVGGRDIEWVDERFERDKTTSYFARVVRADGETAWTSPVWAVAG